LRPWEINRLTIPQARLYLGCEEAVEEPATPSNSFASQAWRLRSRIFDQMCEKWNVSPKQLNELPDQTLWALYTECSKDLVKEPPKSMQQLRERVAEYVIDKSENLI
jgi:hypothetical protein